MTTGVTAIVAGFQHTCALTTGTGARCWGLNVDGQLGDSTLVSRLTPVDVTGLTSGATAMAAGAQHTCAVIGGGAVKCWGDDGSGQLGDNATTQRLTPVVVSGQAGLRTMTAGGLHTCALVSGGGVKCWGSNDNGQLGDNSTTQRLTAVDVVGLTNGVIALATGAGHSCALTSGGGVKCWGLNGNGQLGDSSTVQRLTPVDVSGLTSGVKSIAAGDSHTCALTNAGGVKCWGLNSTGQLGDSTVTQRLVPVDVVGLASGVMAIEAGAAHTCALMNSGGVKCWGWNGYGQVGDNSTTQRQVPVDVSGLLSGASVIAVGQYHTCALAGSGVKCWGWNGYGQIGDNSIIQRLVPTNVNGLSSGVAGIAAGNGHTCAVVSNGVKCWGDNSYGQIGDGTVATARLTPVDVSGPAGVSAVVAGGLHTCARIGGGLACWGLNSNGQLGDNSVTQRPTPADVTGLAALGLVAGGGTHTCALTTGGAAHCWGGNGSGQLGDGTVIRAVAPISASGLSAASALAAGTLHTCAVVGGGGKCWGDNLNGQLGDGTQTPRLAPVDVSGLSGAVAITASVGSDHTCALTSGAGLKCWGNNGNGQLGDNSTTRRLLPVDVSGLTSGAAAASAGQFHTCALTTGGGAKCWGLNGNGQIGDGTQSQRLTPVDVTGLTGGVTAIATGLTHSCGLTGAGGVKCWGLNANGQLGDGTTTQRLTAVNVNGLGGGVAAIAAGASHTCALTNTGGVKCWGLNGNGQLGDGTTTQRSAPVDVTGLASGVMAIAAGQYHTCALTGTAGVKCWGQNNDGELGDGTAGTRPFPGNVLAVGPATQLAITSVNGGGSVAVGTGFNVVVESWDAGGTTAPVTANTGVSLVLVGPGALGGSIACAQSAGTSSCTVVGATIDTAQIGALLGANRTSGDALTSGLSLPFDIFAVPPGAPTGIVAMQTAGGITVTFTPPANTGGAPILSYTVTCNPGAITAVGAASPIAVTGLVSGTPYTCNVRATNSIGTGAVSSPSNTVFYVVSPNARLLVPDGTSLEQSFGAYPDTKWFAIGVEPGKTYVVEAADVDGDLTANAIGTLGVFAPDGVSAPPEASVDCTAANGRRPPAVDVNSEGIRCVLRTALPAAGMQEVKRPVYLKVTRMDPALGGGTQFRIRAREATVYGRWNTAGNDYHVEVENTTGDPMCVEVARYPKSGLTYTAGPGWSGAIASFTLTVPAFGAVKQVIPSGSLVGADGEGALRIGACGAPTNLLAAGLHVSTYAFDPVGNRYIYFFTSTANEGRTRSTW
jgi:alpha-tubulin suppressor-like RCC1 family protein